MIPDLTTGNSTEVGTTTICMPELRFNLSLPVSTKVEDPMKDMGVIKISKENKVPSFDFNLNLYSNVTIGTILTTHKLIKSLL